MFRILRENTSLRILKAFLHFLPIFFLLLYCVYMCFNSAIEKSDAIFILNFSYVACYLLFLWKLLFISHILQCHTSKLQHGSTCIYCAESLKGLFNIETHVICFYDFLDLFLWWLSPLWISCDWNIQPPVLIL